MKNRPINEDDRKFMAMAITLAEENIAQGGGPFGAVIVKEGEVIASAGNRVVPNHDPTAHAEVNAIREACSKLQTFSLKGCTIYASCEPCPMCLSAIYWAGIERVCYANTKADAAAINFDDSFIYDQLSLPEDQRSIAFEQYMHEEALKAFKLWQENPDKIAY